ncbi:MAG: hypothetical protein GY710_12910 [Desulfobacteraceae bacterium]|nr:hypothetical protein [Desulfobacteraceae bacterium]
MGKLDSTDPPAISMKRFFFSMIIPLLLLVNLIFYWLYADQKKYELLVLKNRAENTLLRQKQRIEQFTNNILNDSTFGVDFS